MTKRRTAERITMTRRDLFRRVGGGGMAVALLGSGAGALFRPRRAHAAAAITLDPRIDPLLQGYTTAGNAPYTPGPRLIVDDAAADFRVFQKGIPEIAPGAGDVAVEVEMSVDPGSIGLDGERSGVELWFDEGGGGRQIRACFIERAAQRRIALQLSNGTFTDGITIDWASTTIVRLERRGTDGVVTAGGAGGQEHAVPLALLALAARPSPTFEFGCASGPGRARLSVGPIGDVEPPVFPMTITPAHAVLIPNRIQGVALDGAFQLDPASDGIDPVTDGVALELSTPGGAFYPVGADVMPVGMRAVRGGWGITDAERARTGIEVFLIHRTADPTRFRYVLLDGRSHLPAADYSQVRLDLAIGDDEGAADMTLVAGRRGTWFLP